ncbi:MAG: FadR family transcriptional regulator [Myxococcales bacterium]|nr:FadR family transcriptional regulator [Myxococcales bacterium]
MAQAQPDRKKVADGVEKHLLSLIFGGKYPTGSKLPTERDLSESLGVHRSSVREGIKRLEALGIVSIRQGDGTRVCDFVTNGRVDVIPILLAHAMPNRTDLLRDMVEFRLLTGREIVRLAAMRATDEQVAKMREIAELATTSTGIALHNYDFDLRGAIAQGADNTIFVLLVNTIRDITKSFATVLQLFVADHVSIYEYHRELIDAIAAHDVAKAVAIEDRFLRHGAEMVAKMMTRPGAPIRLLPPA